jgi:aquaporin Z
VSAARTPLSRCLVAECFGTFALVFIGTGAIVMNDVSGGVITHVGVALCFGLVVMAMIDAIGDVSGAHINPAVTVAFALSKRFPWARVGPYIGAQLVGATLASLALRAMFTDHPTLGATIPSGAHSQSFALEVVLTLILMFVILRVATGAKERGILASAAIGGVVAFEAMAAGPISGASMNPARSLAPAIVSMNANALGSLWIYLAAPALGASLAVPLERVVSPSKSSTRFSSTHDTAGTQTASPSPVSRSAARNP